MRLELALIAISVIHRLFEPLSVQEWKEVNTHPGIPRTIHVKLHICWIEVNDLTCWLIQLVVAAWQRMRTLLWEDGEQLLEWLRWLSLLEDDLQLVAAEQVAGEWSIVVWVVPIP
jgi:hypothetical protein